MTTSFFEWRLSFASQKNDMLLRNMIYRLNVDMIGSTVSNMICLPHGKRDQLLTAFVGMTHITLRMISYAIAFIIMNYEL